MKNNNSPKPLSVGIESESELPIIKTDKFTRKLPLFLFFLIIFALVYYFYIHYKLYDKITLENLQNSSLFLKNYVEEHYILSVCIFILIYPFLAVFFLPGADALTITGGYLFGFINVLYINISVLIGDGLSFLLVRYFLGKTFQKKFDKYLPKLNEKIEKHGYKYFITLRMLAIVPFFMINVLGGLSKVPLRTYLWTTSLGILPGYIVYTYAGKSLQNVQSVKDIFSPNIILAFILVALLSFLPYLIKGSVKEDLRP